MVTSITQCDQMKVVRASRGMKGRNGNCIQMNKWRSSKGKKEQGCQNNETDFRVRWDYIQEEKEGLKRLTLQRMRKSCMLYTYVIIF